MDVHRSRIDVTEEYAKNYLQNNKELGKSICYVGKVSAVKNTGITDFFTKKLIDILRGVTPVTKNKGIFKDYYETDEQKNICSC